MSPIRASLAIAVTFFAIGAQTSCSSDSTKSNGNPDGGDAASTPVVGDAAGAGSDAPRADGAADGGTKEVVFANAGLTLDTFDLNPVDGTLTPTASMTLPQTLQVADFDPAFRHLYVGATAAATATTAAVNMLYAYTIDQSTGLLAALGTPVVSSHGRVINLSISGDSKYFLAAHNVTKQYSVFNLSSDGSIGTEVPQADGGDTNLGGYLHQVRVDPSGQYALICDRGNDPTTVMTDAGAVTTPEDLGHLLVFSFSSGVLTPRQTITFPPGIGPRHLDFHPTKPWIYVAAERGSRLITYSFQNGMLTESFNQTSLAVAADATLPNQRAGEIKVDSSGQYLWVTNRNLATVADPGDSAEAGADAAGPLGEAGADAALVEAGSQEAGAQDAGAVRVFAGGENNIALFSIDPTTGEPTFVDATEAHGFEPRSFAVDASRQFLIVGNQRGMLVRQGSTLTRFATNLSVFRLAADGRPSFRKSYERTAGDVLWVGSSALSGP